MRVLVTGGTGLLGYNLVKELISRGYTAIATYREHKPLEPLDAEWIYMNLESYDSIRDAIARTRPDIVIHTAAYTDVDGCEISKDKAYRVNYLATSVLARNSLKNNSFVIYISTDYVFYGDRGLYREEDIPNPVNYYGLTKLLGEASLSSLPENKYLIIRISGLYGYSLTGKKNFGSQLVERLLRRESVNAFYDQYLSPTYVYFLAMRIADAIEKELSGMIHIAGERMSRYKFAVAVAEKLGVEKNLVKPISMSEAKLVARRPRDSSLDTSKARELNLSMPSQDVCLEHFVDTYRRLVKEVHESGEV